MTQPTYLTDRYTRAFELARALHGGEFRKKTDIPYLSHVMSVSAIVLEHGGSEDQAIAALLHDAAEDHGGQARVDQIRAEFGDTVADIVAACSDSLVEDRTEKAPWWDRKVAYLDHLSGVSSDAALVSAADKLHNARSILADYRKIEEDLWKRFNTDAGRPGSLWYYRSLVTILKGRVVGEFAPVLIEELDRTVQAIIRLVEKEGFDAETDLAMARTLEAAARERMKQGGEPELPEPAG